MDELFSKAIDALDLNEFPHSGSAGGEAGGAGSDADVLSVPPSAVEAARRVLAAWEEIELEARKAAWDEAGLAISANQEASTRNRRSLAEQTKAFKAGGGGAANFSTLLKAYQAEVDSLTKRAKHAEASFLGVYQLLYDAPDVLPILRSFGDVSGRVASAEQDMRRMRQELEVIKGDAASAKGMQAHIRRLEERNSELEERLEEKVQEAVAAKEKEMQQSMGLADSRQQALRQQLQDLQQTIAALQRQHDDAQSALFDAKARWEEELAAKQSELDAALEDLETSQGRVAALERAHAEAVGEVLSSRKHMGMGGDAPNGRGEGEPAALGSPVRGAGDAGAVALGLSPLGRRLVLPDALGGRAGGPGSSSSSPGRVGLESSTSGLGLEAMSPLAEADDGRGEVAKERLVSHLHAELQQLEQALQSEREGRAADAEAAQKQAAAAEEEREALQRELEVRPTEAALEELRKHIRILQAMAGTDVYEEWPEGAPRSSLEQGPGSQRRGGKAGGEEEEGAEEESEWARIQAALKESNRRLQAEVTGARTQLAEKTLEAEEAAAQLVALGEQCAELRALVTKLEEDIVRGSGSLRELLGRRGTGAEPWAEAGSAGGIQGLLHRGAEASALLPGTLGAHSQVGPAAGAGAGEETLEAGLNGGGGGDGAVSAAPLSDEDSMLLIVCDQRERFRKRVKELEEESGLLQDSLGKARLEIQRLTTDNLTLYEKIRFLEHYNRESGGGAAGRHAQALVPAGVGTGPALPHASEASVGPGSGSGTETRYRKLYEEKMNPFAEFHQKEQERSYRNLRLHDKITLTSSRFLLSNKYGRTFVFFYTVLLHVFILIILYRSSHPRTSLALGCQPLSQGVPAVRHPRVAPVEEEDAGGAGGEGKTLADVFAEGVGTLMQTTKELTNGRRRRRML